MVDIQLTKGTNSLKKIKNINEILKAENAKAFDFSIEPQGFKESVCETIYKHEKKNKKNIDKSLSNSYMRNCIYLYLIFKQIKI